MSRLTPTRQPFSFEVDGRGGMRVALRPGEKVVLEVRNQGFSNQVCGARETLVRNTGFWTR
jgi:hypothetical protein